MTRTELNQFLHQYTQVEKVLINILTNDESDETELSFSEEEQRREKDYLTKDEIIKNFFSYLENPGKFSKINESMLTHSEDRITFLIHPRVFVMKDTEVKEHRHIFIELIYVFSGQCSQTIEGSKMILNEGDICILNTYMIILFAELLRGYRREVNTKNYKELKQTKISDIILYLQQNYKAATLASTAQYFNFNPAYLSQIFKKITGTGFKDFLQQSKLERACTLLRETDLTVEEIAYDIGYMNMSFFYRLFKNHYGLTPHEFRKQERKE